ncbi:hypothetical protein [Pseudomonas sp. S37]|uniref:hypothetical protein n=1 Tax=Pseudomonas sp. S37 TaxID=2767449 RepID=UPI0019140DDD|nr:hypothetical protein [Pseudomonas sp. S37]
MGDFRLLYSGHSLQAEREIAGKRKPAEAGKVYHVGMARLSLKLCENQVKEKSSGCDHADRKCGNPPFKPCQALAIVVTSLSL